MQSSAAEIQYAGRNNILSFPAAPAEPRKQGKKSEVYAFSVEDAKHVLSYFKDHEMWTQYLLFTFGLNMARRVGDLLSMKWEDIFNPTTGKLRSSLEIREQKTKKYASITINQAVREAVDLFLQHTGRNPAENFYGNFVFTQTSGNYKGRVITDNGYRQSLKKAATACGIEYNVGTHSTRKTFGAMSRMIHPGDYDSMQLLQSIYNHSDEKTTERYIGLTQEKVNRYYNDMGAFFEDYIAGDKEYSGIAAKPVVSLDVNDLRSILTAAYQAGTQNAGNPDPLVHIEAINTVLCMVESVAK